MQAASPWDRLCGTQRSDNERTDVRTTTLTVVACVPALTTTVLFAQEAATDEKAKVAEVAMKLQNQGANLMSVLIQNNWNFYIGSQRCFV